MHDISLLQAWQLWLAGQRLDQITLWGHPMFLWARLGKVIEFVAALFLLIEIAGPKAVRGFADDLLRFREAIGRLFEVVIGRLSDVTSLRFLVRKLRREVPADRPLRGR